MATSADHGTSVWLYNLDASAALTVHYITRATVGGASVLVTNTLGVPAGGYLRQLIPPTSAAHFSAPDGRPFYAIAAIDSVNAAGSNQTTDWGFTLVPGNALTRQVLVGMGWGRDPLASENPNENGSPVWITPIGNGNQNATVYVDFDADPNTGAYTDPNGNRYDLTYSLRELEIQKIYNPAKPDQSGMLAYTFDEGVMLAAAWGQEPGVASTGRPGLDLGTGIPPLPLFNVYKHCDLAQDADSDGFISPGDLLRYTIWIENTGRQPLTGLTVTDHLPESLQYYVTTTTFTDHTNAIHDVADDSAGATLFPLDENGYMLPLAALPVRSQWAVSYETRVPSYEELASGTITLVNMASVNGSGTTATNGVVAKLNGRIGDRVWYDIDHNGLQDAGEPGVPGVPVSLLDASGNPVRNSRGEYIEAVTDVHGGYELLGVPAGDYRVAFAPPGGYDFTTANADGEGMDGALNSTPDAVTGITAVFTMQGGERKTTLDAGLVKTSLISGFAWIDGNGDGLKDADEPGLNGITVRLYDGNGNPVAGPGGQSLSFVTTDNPASGAAGGYHFSRLPAGNYQVEFVLSGSEAFTVRDSNGLGVLGANNSDAGIATGRTLVFALAAEQWITSIDAGVLSRVRATKASNAGATVAPGDVITYTIAVTNNGATAQSGVAVWDQMPAGVTYVPDSLEVELADPYVYTSVTFTASGSFTMPNNVNSVIIEVWGGGGRGGTRTSNGAGGGGGGGAYSKGRVAVTPGHSYTINVGAGSSTTAAGGDSWVSADVVGNALVLARGGASAPDNNDNGAAGGAAAAGIGDLRYAGGNGANIASSRGGGGGSSAAPSGAGVSAVGNSGAIAPAGGGNGGDGKTGTQGNGTAGAAPGGGGGGAYRSSSGTRTGGAGAGGMVVITYAQPVSHIYNASDTFTVPPGVRNIVVETWGGGGRGGTRTSNGAGGGGGGGAYSKRKIAVTPGRSYTVNVGAGSSTAAAGGDSWVSPDVVGNALVLAKGGASVPDNNNSGAAGGAAAAGIGDLRYAGGNGANEASSRGGGGGSSAAPAGAGVSAVGNSGAVAPVGGGNGGAGRTGTQGNGTAGAAPGGGGGGGAYRSSSGTRTGGNGANGRVVITYSRVLAVGDTGNAPNLAGGWTIPAGNALTVRYQVVVDGPPVTVADVSNTAFVTTDDYPEPFTPHVETPVDNAYLAAIGNRVWLDNNGNGLQDAGESGMTNIVVALYRVHNGAITNNVGSMTTDDLGHYLFSRQVPGSYLVRTAVPSGHVATAAAIGGDGTIDSNGDAAGWSGLTIVSGGEQNATIDFGFYMKARLYGYAYGDPQLCLVRKPSSPGASNMVVQIWREGVFIAATNANAGGYYEFVGLVPGSYEIRFMGSNSHLTARPDAGSDEASDPERNRAEPDVNGYGRIDYGLCSGAGVGGNMGEPLNAGYLGVGPLSSGIDLRAYMASDGVYVEFVAYDVAIDGWFTLMVLDRHGNMLWYDDVAAVAGARQVVRFRVPGLASGQRCNFTIIDEVGLRWEASDVLVGAFAAEMISMAQHGVRISFATLPGRNYEVEWCARLGAAWQRVASLQAQAEKTTVIVEPPETASATGFFRIIMKD